VTKENVFKVCDTPHPDLMTDVIKMCLASKFTEACSLIDTVYHEGYNLVDIINILTKVM
jgi:replication factor C subunit 2/4